MKSYLNKVAQTVFALITSQCIIGQTLVLKSGASINTTGNIAVVVQNGNVTNNGAILGTGKLLLTGSSAENISGTGTINNLELNNTAGATITSGSGNMTSLTGTLTITNGTLTTSGNLTLKSDASVTARVAPIVNGSITGNITIERYNSNKRAWRLLGIPYSSSTQTIKDGWMENKTAPAGYGTQVTTYSTPTDPNAANFDGQKPSSSIRIYAADNFNSDAAHTPNTTNLITTNPGYFLFVRGDRTVDRTASPFSTSATALRTAGIINQGNVTKGVTGTSFSLIPNPYPSAIDFDVVKASNTSISTFYVWDATLAGTNGVGQYRTVQITGTAPNYTYTATPGGANTSWRYIESGTAFFIAGNGTVTFNEAMKTAGIPPSSMLRIASPNQTELAVNLNVVNPDNTISLADGVREVFDNHYSAMIDNNDAKKIAGFNLNLGISSNSEILAIEKRPLPNTNEVIILSLSNMAQGNYQFEIQPANLPSGLTPYLKDNYLGTYFPIDVTADTKINFTITADTASSSQSRFSIVFGKPQLVNPNSLITVYPNPVSNGVVSLQMNNMPKGIYSVRLLNAVGQTILTKQINHAEGSSTETFAVNKVKGVYTIEVTKPDNSKTNSKIIIN